MPDSALADFTNQDPAEFLAFVEEYREINDRIAADIGDRKDLRKRVKGAGYDLGAFDQAFKDSEKSGELRERKHREYLRNMAWMGKPVGFQGAMQFDNGEDLSGPPAAAAEPEVSPQQVARVQDEARSAAVNGQSRQRNPWSPGSYLAQVWDDNWVEAHDEQAAAAAPPPSVAAPSLTPAGKRRGRPPGSRNRPRNAA